MVLINAVKDVAKALGNLISATKAAAGKPHDDPSMLQLKNSAKVSHMRLFTCEDSLSALLLYSNISICMNEKREPERENCLTCVQLANHAVKGA